MKKEIVNRLLINGHIIEEEAKELLGKEVYSRLRDQNIIKIENCSLNNLIKSPYQNPYTITY